MRKIDDFVADFSAFFLRKIDFLMYCIWFYYKKVLGGVTNYDIAEPIMESKIQIEMDRN